MTTFTRAIECRAHMDRIGCKAWALMRCLEPKRNCDLATIGREGWLKLKHNNSW